MIFVTTQCRYNEATTFAEPTMSPIMSYCK